MPGEVIELEGDATALVNAVAVLRHEGFQFALVGGLAVMLRLAEAHRATGDLDGVFDNASDVPTTESLVASGIADDDPHALQRVTVEGTSVDVIDTFELPDETDALPDGAKDRLFVCAHRYAYDTATSLYISDGGEHVEVSVATPAGLVATKSHALRFATAARRSTKRTSDLYDLYRLLADYANQILEDLANAPWALGVQVTDALKHNLHVAQDTALMRQVRGGPTLAADDFADVMTEFLDRV